MRAPLLLVVTAACGRFDFDARGDGRGGDGGGDAAGDAAQCMTFGPWGNVQHLEALESTTNDWSPALSADMLAVVFDSGRLGGDDLFVATRETTTQLFGAPVPISNLNSGTANEYNTSWIGNSIVYSSYDPTSSVFALLRAPYLGGGVFGDPQPTNDPSCDAFAMSSDELELFCTLNPMAGQYNLAHGTRLSATSNWTLDSQLDPFTPMGASAGWPSFDEVRQTLYFERHSGATSPEIAMITRATSTSPFGAATAVTTVGPSNGDPEVSRDGSTLIFASDRAGTVGLNDLYIATRTCQ